ncbi:MAG TPA: Gfo/Idh/MocA family oxidoreductase [bacterium]|nr:Gfo/Idh/MocA family oxidoreductase [bacterium]
MKYPKICLIGAGKHSTNRIYPYISVAGGKIVGVCDINFEKAKENSERFGGIPYVDYKKMLERENPDGVIICINAEMHSKLAKEIMKMGYNVYVEKPPATSSEDAFEMAIISKETGKICATGFKKRYANAYKRAKEWIETFSENSLYSISIDYASGKFKNTSLDDTFLFDFAIHAFDLVFFLFGDVEKVFTFAKDNDAYSVSLKFKNGAVGSMNLTDMRGGNIPTEEVEITLENGNCMTIHNSSIWKISENGKPSEWREPPTFISAGDSGYETGHLPELIDFMNAIKNNTQTVSNIFTSYKTMVLYEGVIESVKTGKVIELKYKNF